MLGYRELEVGNPYRTLFVGSLVAACGCAPAEPEGAVSAMPVPVSHTTAHEDPCKRRYDGTMDPGESIEKFCSCWTRKVSRLDEANRKILAELVSDEITENEFENADAGLAEFLYNVEVHCSARAKTATGKKK